MYILRIQCEKKTKELSENGEVTKHEEKNGTLPETNIAHENPIFPGKYHQNARFSMAMLVSGRVQICVSSHEPMTFSVSMRSMGNPSKLFQVEGGLGRWEKKI